jgi:hypothetical protein
MLNPIGIIFANFSNVLYIFFGEDHIVKPSFRQWATNHYCFISFENNGWNEAR